MAVIGKMAVMLTANTADFSRKMKKATKRTSALKKGLVGVGIAAAALGGIAARGVLTFTDSLLQLGKAQSELNQIGEGLGVTALSMLRLQRASIRAGVDVKRAADLIGELNKKVAEARDFGTGEGVEVFAALGLSAGDLSDPIKGVVRLSEAMQGLDRAAQLSIWDRLTGADAEDMRLLMDLPGLMREAERATADITGQSLRNISRVAQLSRDMRAEWQLFKTVVVSELLPALRPLIRDLATWLRDPENIMRVVDTLRALADAISGLGSALNSIKSNPFTSGAATYSPANPFSQRLQMNFVPDVIEAIESAKQQTVLIAE